MDAGGNIYELSEEQLAYVEAKPTSEEVQVLEDTARFDGFMRRWNGEAKLSGSRKHEKMVYGTHENRNKPYVKEAKMGIENIETISNDQGDPGDEQPEVGEQGNPGVGPGPVGATGDELQVEDVLEPPTEWFPLGQVESEIGSDDEGPDYGAA